MSSAFEGLSSVSEVEERRMTPSTCTSTHVHMNNTHASQGGGREKKFKWRQDRVIVDDFFVSDSKMAHSAKIFCCCFVFRFLFCLDRTKTHGLVLPMLYHRAASPVCFSETSSHYMSQTDPELWSSCLSLPGVAVSNCNATLGGQQCPIWKLSAWVSSGGAQIVPVSSGCSPFWMQTQQRWSHRAPGHQVRHPHCLYSPHLILAHPKNGPWVLPAVWDYEGCGTCPSFS